jgi:hypothetical protein
VCIAAIVLFILGSMLEVAGILLVVAELRADRTKALEIAKISIPTVTRDPLESSPEPASWTIQAALDKDRQLAPQRAQVETSRRLQRALVDVLMGTRRLRVWGVWLLVGGVIVSTAGNVVATLC